VERPVPKEAFLTHYPKTPSTFGEHLRKARMDAGLQIKQLAEQLGVSQDSVINWEIRGMRPARGNVEKLRNQFPELNTHMFRFLN